MAGNIFEASDEYALGYCVSQYFQISQGLGFEFKKKFNLIEKLKNKKKTNM